MENASKALVMAGAVLLAVMLISLGVFVFNIMQDPTKTIVSNADTTRDSFNSQIYSYVGKNKDLATAYAAINKARSITGEHTIKVSGKTPNSGQSKYEISVEYDEYGYINKLIIN